MPDFSLTYLDDQDHWSGPAFAASDWPAHCLATLGSTAAHWGWRPCQLGADALVELTASNVLELLLPKGCTGPSCHGCTQAGPASEQAGVQAPAGVPGAVAAG